MDMSQFVVPKSDQLNADDLIAGPRTITIARVSGTGAADQPVAVHFDGDGGKPFKPCKSMRRVMISAWGVDASAYAGRRMTLYRDPKVAFGGMEVGGIRISHMSHIEKTLNLALTVTKAKRAPYRVEPLADEKPSDAAGEAAGRLIARIQGAKTSAALDAIVGDHAVSGWIAKAEKSRPDLAAEIRAAITARINDFAADSIAGQHDPADAGMEAEPQS